MNLNYFLPRLIRHFLPHSATRLLLRYGWFIRPGKETAEPRAALLRYRHTLEPYGISWVGKRVLVFGYGGYFAVGCGLLESGASHVILCDKYAPADEARNRSLLPQYAPYLYQDGRHIRPRPEKITLLEADIREISLSAAFLPVDLVLSSDVFEHLEDVEGITRSLAKITRPDGAQVHFIDLRDHFFKYPFEMLCYSEVAWRKWLNPGSHHNRYPASRLPTRV